MIEDSITLTAGDLAPINLASEFVKIANSSNVFSDVMLVEDMPIMLNYPRGWEALTDTPVDRQSIEDFLDKYAVGKHGKPGDWKAKLEGPEGSFIFSKTLTKSRLRFNVAKGGSSDGEDYKIAITARRIFNELPTFESIGLPHGIHEMANTTQGLILIVGGTNCGKSTTQAAFLDYINKLRADHIITIESPIEYIHKNQKSIFMQREVPTHVSSYQKALEVALGGQNPDVIMVSEVKDKATVDALYHAAESGHLVFATLHANSAASAIDRLLSFYDGAEANQKAKVLSSVLIGIISQSLLPNSDGKDYELAYEVMLNNEQIRASIAKRETESQIASVMKLNIKHGSVMCMLNDTLAKKVKEGKIKITDARMAAYDVDDLNERLAKQS